MRTLDTLYRYQRATRAMLAPLKSEVVGLVRRIVVGSTSAASGDTARSRGSTFGDRGTEGEQLQQFGFASSPQDGSEGVYFPKLNVMICVDSRANRPSLAAGESAQWSDHGQKVWLREDGSVLVEVEGGSKLEIASDGSINATADNGALIEVDASGNVNATPSGAGLVKLASASDFVALAAKVDGECNKIAATLATGSNSGGPVVFATPYVPASTAGTGVQAS